MKNIKLSLVYDGSSYLGWQKTCHGASIEEVLESTLKKILQHDVKLQAASRTDAGVHALDQSVNFYTEKNVNLSQLRLSLNQLLPSDIKINSVDLKGIDFHPTLDALGKIYRYKLCNLSYISPFERTTAWHYPTKICIEKIKAAKKHLIGKKNFLGFSNFRIPPYKSSICEIFNLEVLENQGYFDFLVSGDHFLYKMVRNLIGTLVYIGASKLKLEDLDKILIEKCRTYAGVTAPAHGLFLEKVIYPQEDL